MEKLKQAFKVILFPSGFKCSACGERIRAENVICICGAHLIGFIFSSRWEDVSCREREEKKKELQRNYLGVRMVFYGMKKSKSRQSEIFNSGKPRLTMIQGGVR